MKRCVYHVKNTCRPGVIHNAARECNLDAMVSSGSNVVMLLVVLPIDREIENEDLRAFENMLRVGQVEFERKRVD